MVFLYTIDLFLWQLCARNIYRAGGGGGYPCIAQREYELMMIIFLVNLFIYLFYILYYGI